MSSSVASSRVAPPCLSSSTLDFDFSASPPAWVWDEVRLAVAQQQSKASSLPRSTPPPSQATHVGLAPARRAELPHCVGRLLPEAFNIVGSRIPRARPSHTGSQVKHSFTFNFAGYAVHAATLEAMRKSLPSALKSIQ